MKISSEAKVGLIGIATLALLIWGINYLKGRNILNSTYTLHAFYEDSGGLENSSPILMQGIKIGYIDDIELQQGQELPVHVIIHIEKQYPVNTGSTASLFSADLLGSKAIRIDSPGSGQAMQNNDTILTATESDMIASINSQVMPVMEQIGNLSESLDSVAQKLNKLLDSEAPGETLQDLSEISASLSSSLSPGGALYMSFQNLESFTSMLESQEDELKSMTSHLNSISETVDSAGIDRIAAELIAASEAFTQLMTQLNSGEGSMGKLLYSDTLYAQLQNLVVDLDSLIVDLNENPKDYVRFSVFGKK
ncbi:MAG: MCE family protein [Bacteroidales bacterium]|nr:MCE family protein [Bacteroidales bacterium]